MSSDEGIWLEGQDGTRVPVRGTCSLGRSASNQLVLSDQMVSRRHAFVHAQGESEYWLVDLGSSNGTYLNGRRVSQPVKLSDGDRLTVGPFDLRFRQPSGPERTGHDSEVLQTLPFIRTLPCWLLLADIAGSTRLAQELSPDELPQVVGAWFSRCREIIDSTQGAINKYLGDGFFAYWTDGQSRTEQVLAALDRLRALQTRGTPAFRIALHHGKVLMGGVPSMGEESLSGPEVNFIFRMEKIAAGMQVAFMLSEAAQLRLEGCLATRDLGRHAVPGFPGEHPFHVAEATGHG